MVKAYVGGAAVSGRLREIECRMLLLLGCIRFLCGVLLLTVLIWSLVLYHNTLLTAVLAVGSHLGWRLGRWIDAQGQLACQIVRAVLLILTLAMAMMLSLNPHLELAALTHCGFAVGVLIALTSPHGGGRRSRRARRTRHFQVSFPTMRHLPLRRTSASVRSR